MKYRLTISDAISLALLAAVGALFLFLYSIDGDIGKWVREGRAAERMQLISEIDQLNLPRTETASVFGKGWFIIKDNACQNLDVEKVMNQVAAAKYPDMEIMETYALCAELGFKPVLRRETELPPLPSE